MRRLLFEMLEETKHAKRPSTSFSAHSPSELRRPSASPEVRAEQARLLPAERVRRRVAHARGELERQRQRAEAPADLRTSGKGRGNRENGRSRLGRGYD